MTFQTPTLRHRVQGFTMIELIVVIVIQIGRAHV